METKTSIQQASQENGIVRRAREALRTSYEPTEIAMMEPHEAMQVWQQMVCAEADAFVRSQTTFPER